MYEVLWILAALFVPVSAAPLETKYIIIIAVVVAVVLLVAAVRILDTYHICDQLRTGNVGKAYNEDDGTFEMKEWKGFGYKETLQDSLSTPPGFQSRRFRPEPVATVDLSPEEIKEILKNGLPERDSYHKPERPAQTDDEKPVKMKKTVEKPAKPSKKPKLSKQEKEENLRRELEKAINKERVDPYFAAGDSPRSRARVGRVKEEDIIPVIDSDDDDTATPTTPQERKLVSPEKEEVRDPDDLLSPMARRALLFSTDPGAVVDDSPSPSPPRRRKRSRSPEKSARRRSMNSDKPRKRSTSPPPRRQSGAEFAPLPPPGYQALYSPYYHPMYHGPLPTQTGETTPPYPVMYHPYATLPHPGAMPHPGGVPVLPHGTLPHPSYSSPTRPAEADTAVYPPAAYPYPYPAYYAPRPTQEAPTQSHQTSQL